MSKRDVESLLARYDAEPVLALTDALRIALERDGSWPELIAATGFTDTRKAALMLGEQGALDDLAAELNELRRPGRICAADADPPGLLVEAVPPGLVVESEPPGSGR